jgi:long-chain acyl-CoA synthetase
MSAPLPLVHDSVVAMLDHAVADFGDRRALVHGDQALSFLELRRCVGALSRLLGKVAPPGACIATILGNSMVAAVAPYAIAEAGCVHVPLNPLYTARELGYMLDDSAPAVVVVDDALIPTVKPLLIASVPGCQMLPASEIAGRLLTWRADAAPIVGKSHYPQPGAIALVQYTGGSTGRPKGVQLTHRAVNTNIAQREALLPVVRGRENVLCVMPLFHSYAMAMGLYLSGYSASTLVILPGYHPERLLEAMEQHEISIFPGSPTIFAGLMNCERFSTTRWSRVHTC